MALNDAQAERYSRQIILKDVGGKGQERLLASRVLIVGAGGLGAPAALYLGAAGVGTLGIVDSDSVDVSNLQRQIIHGTPDVGNHKVASATSRIESINPDVKVVGHRMRLSAENVRSVIGEYDFVIDGTDNFPAKYLINDACVFLGKAFSHAGILRFEGQTFTHVPGGTCYRCVFPTPPPKGLVPTCSQAGILGSVAGIIGTIQATEAVKFILCKGSLLSDRLLVVDALAMKFREVSVRRNANCPVCGNSPVIRELRDEVLALCDLKAARQ